jgi:NAD(P)H-flavin reductase
MGTLFDMPARTPGAIPFPPAGDLYVPRLSRVLAVRHEVVESASSRAITSLSLERGGFDHRPGQFYQVGVFGLGEVPISISSPPGLAGQLTITVRDAGPISSRLAHAEEGMVLGLRGPVGNGFDVGEHEGRDVLFVAGGIGLAPLRGLLWEMLLRRARFGRVIVLHGARSPADLLYPWQYAEWRALGVELLLSVDRGDGRWEKEEDPPRAVGFLTALFPRLALDPARTTAFLCGPPVMIRVACQQLIGRHGIAPEHCWSTLERHMKCGVGKCGHCVVVDRYICVDGPVFRYDELTALERIEPPW